MKVLLTLAALGSIGALSACNTVQGLGEDLTAGGAAIEEAAYESRQPGPTYARPPAGSTVFEAGPSRDQDPSLAAKPTTVYQNGQRYTAPPAYQTQPAYGAQPTYQTVPSYQGQPTYQQAPPPTYQSAPQQTYIETPTYQPTPTPAPQPTYIY